MSGEGKLAVQRKEAARLLSISVDTFDKYVRTNVPVVYVGDIRLFPVVGLEAWLRREAERRCDPDDNTKRPRTAGAAQARRRR